MYPNEKGGVENKGIMSWLHNISTHGSGSSSWMGVGYMDEHIGQPYSGPLGRY